MMLILAALALPASAFALDDALMITGYVDGEFMAQQQLDGSTADPTDTTWRTSFGDASEALFWVNGHPAETVNFATEVDYQQSTNTLSLNQAMIDWMVAGERFAMRFGKFYFPFGIEARSRYSTTNRLVTQPSAGPMGPAMVGWTDNGVGLHGVMKTSDDMSWSWDVAVTNGRSGVGLATQTTDANNNNKAIGGRIEVMPMAERLNIGGSFALGAWDAAGDNNYMLAGGHLIADLVENLDIRGEFYWQQLKDVPAGATTADFTAMAFYAQGAYRYPIEGWNYIEPVARFGWMDPDTDSDDDAFNQIAVGLNFSPVEHFILKGEFDINGEPTGGDVDNNTFLFQGVYGW
jgi:hypothetical protein